MRTSEELIGEDAGTMESETREAAAAETHVTNRAEANSEIAVTRRNLLKGAAGAVVAAPLMLDEAVAQRRPGRARGRGAAAAPGGTAGKRPRFFSPAEFALLDELTEMIIPTDDHSPGARAAGVATYLDRRVAEGSPAMREYAELRQTWRNGLQLIDRVAQDMHGKLFMAVTPEQRVAVLTRLAEQEPQPAPPRQPNPPSEGQQPVGPTQAPGQPGQIYQQGAQNNPEQRAPGGTRKSEGDFFTFLKTQIARAYYTSEIGIHKELEYKGNQYLQEFVGYDMSGKYTDAPKSDVSQRRGE